MYEEVVIGNFKQGEEVEIENLVKKVYDEFVAQENTSAGNLFFYHFITSGEILARYKEKTDTIITAKFGNKIVGVLSVKNADHISLLFVDKKFQGNGISKSMFNYFLNQIKDTGITEITVNASLFSEKIYEKLGFTSQSGAQETNGIKFIPMRMRLTGD